MKSRHLIAALALITVMLTLGSCSSKRKMVYFQDIDQITAAIPAGDFQIKIVPDDELSISVTAPDQDAAAPYNMPYQPLQNSDYTTASVIESSGIQRRNQYMRYQPYKVTADGFINFPVLGRLHVAGMTPEQLAQFIEEKVADKVNNPIVTVNLMNFHVNVIGAVGRPGSIPVNRERYSVLDAIADAGDLSVYGDRSNILLIREVNGERTYHRYDLTKGDILADPNFYLQQNDVIYVEPNKILENNIHVDQQRQFRLSMTSVIVSALSTIASLCIAFLVK